MSTGFLHGTILLNIDDSFTFTPNAGFFGQDCFELDLVSTVFGRMVGQGPVTITAESYGYLLYLPPMYKQEAGK